jgi:hypothetical protein
LGRYNDVPPFLEDYVQHCGPSFVVEPFLAKRNLCKVFEGLPSKDTSGG